MKKFICILSLSIVFMFVFPVVISHAESYTLDQVKTILIVPYNYGADGFDVIGFLDDSVDIINKPYMSGRWTLTGSYAGVPRPLTSFNSSWTIDTIIDFLNTQCTGFGYSGGGYNPDYPTSMCSIVYIYRGSVGSSIPGVTPLTPRPPDPPEPEPGSTWLSDVWEWILWQLGINDDYSGDIDVYITGGDREPMELVTPSPTPSPTPVPSPTPYTLDIIDNNGNPVYTITGIPGSTYNITNTTNNNDGSDFDIFEVDLKIGDGNSTNPRDGLNSVMDSSKDYLSDNVDTSLIGDLFSVIPNDWFLFIGVLAALPFIAGFISKLLK